MELMFYFNYSPECFIKSLQKQKQNRMRYAHLSQYQLLKSELSLCQFNTYKYVQHFAFINIYKMDTSF